jgi:preprotein translocase subunit YajC
MFITSAYAQAASGAAQGPGSIMSSLLPIALIIPVFYFLLIRPQQKKAKEHKALVSAIKRGDRVVTTGGILGVVTKVIDNGEIQLEIADGVRVRILRASISDVINRSDPARTQDNSAEKKGDTR